MKIYIPVVYCSFDGLVVYYTWYYTFYAECTGSYLFQVPWYVLPILICMRS